MWKKLLVFSLAFGLSLILLQFLKPKVQPHLVEIIPSPTILNNSSPVQTNKQISSNNSSSFEDLFQKFKNAVAQNDKETIASLINFPLTVGFMDKKDKPYFKEIKNSDEFFANYNKIFDETSIKCIALADNSNGGLIKTSGYNSSGEFFNISFLKLNRRLRYFSVTMDRIYKNDNTNFEIKIIKFFKD